MSKSKNNDWYLVDFGNADKYVNPDGSHREEKPDKKRANNGTVEYRSRDAHIGLISRRSDIECLAYNIIQWLYGKLPWMTCLADANKVEEAKKKFMASIDQSLKKSFGASVPTGLKEFFVEVNRINFKDTPKYDLLKQLLNKMAKSRTNDRRSRTNEEEDEEKEVEEKIRRKKKAYSSESESVVESLRMNSPVKHPKSPEKQTKTRRNLKNRSAYQESDYEESDSSVEIIKSPPKRSRALPTRKSPREATKMARSPIKSPTRPVRAARPSAFVLYDSDMEESSEEDSGSDQNSLSEVELSRNEGPVETAAMKAMRELIEKKKNEKSKRKGGKRTK